MPPKITIRPLLPKDVEAVYDLHTRAIEETCAKAYTPEAIAVWSRGRSPQGYLHNQQKGETFFVALHAETPIGFCGFMNGELCGLYIDPAYHKQNIGSQLLKTAEAEARKSGQPITHLKSTLNARTFYEGHGYKLIRPDNITRQGVEIPQLYMEKTTT